MIFLPSMILAKTIPKRPGRIKAIREQLEKSELISQCDAIPLRAITDDEVRLAHTNGYLKTVITEIDGTSSGTLSTGDTNFGKRSLNVARNAAGGLLNAIDSVVKRETKNAFCAVRPSWSSRIGRSRHGVLHFQQRGHRGALCKEETWNGACRDYRLGCASRKRNAAYLHRRS